MREEGKAYFLGCSGYFYWSWKGRFYPEDLSPKGWLSYYARFFNTVEINSTFYSFPKKGNLRRFYRETPEGFTISVKANRTITHLKKFRETEELVREFYSTVQEALDEKLGSVLFQLPPSFTHSEEKLERILNQLDPGFKNVLEFRHESWWREEVYEELEKRNIAFCSVSSSKLPEELVQTANFLYVRFHGRKGGHRYDYSEEELKRWAKKLKGVPAKEVYAYFNNDYNAYAPHNCLKLTELLEVRPYPEEP